MLSYLQSAEVVAAGMVLTFVLAWGLNRMWELEDRRRLNSVMGLQLTVLGTTYAVVLGFMLSNVWTAFRSASVDAAMEANAVTGVFHAAEALPEPSRGLIQGLAKDYAEAVVKVEWPAMAARLPERPADPIVRSMWATVSDVGSTTPTNVYSSAVNAVQSLEQQRTRRIEQYRNHIPGILWVVMAGGAVLVITSLCLFGNERPQVHYFYVLSTAFLVLVSLAAMMDIDRPFEGGLYVKPEEFRSAIQDMKVGAGGKGANEAGRLPGGLQPRALPARP